jgi:diaminopimelate decarboxylase
VGTPAYVYSADAFLDPLKALQKGLASVDHMVCFAVKSNSNVAVLKRLASEGAGMDLVSGGELFRARAAGVSAERIVFSGVGKTPEEMKQALGYQGRSIYSFNVESVPELKTLSDVAVSMGRRAPVALRFNPNVDAKTHPYISTGLKKNKFGINRDELVETARSLKSFPGIQLKGISIHIGSQLLSLSPLRDAFELVRKLADELAKTLPEPLEFVDLGGGVGITYANEKAPSIEKYCQMIVKCFGPKAAKASGKPLRVLIEPGRFIAGNSGVLVSRVLYRKERKSKDFLVLDAAMNDLMRPALYGSHHEIVPVAQKFAKGPKKKTSIVGPVCESADCFASDRSFPAAPNRGDLVAILSAGAYGFTMASNYNSRPRIAEVLVENGQYRVIRERESYEDLIRGEKY